MFLTKSSCDDAAKFAVQTKFYRTIAISYVYNGSNRLASGRFDAIGRTRFGAQCINTLHMFTEKGNGQSLIAVMIAADVNHNNSSF